MGGVIIVNTVIFHQILPDPGLCRIYAETPGLLPEPEERVFTKTPIRYKNFTTINYYNSVKLNVSVNKKVKIIFNKQNFIFFFV